MKKNIICEQCKKNEATIYYEQTINGKKTQYNLCEECAEKMGIGTGIDIMPSFDSAFEDMFSQMFFGLPSAHDARSLSAPLQCPVCKATLSDIERTSRMGCSECYSVFGKHLDSRLIPTEEYMGRKPAGFKEKLGELKKDIKEKLDDIGRKTSAANPVDNKPADKKSGEEKDNEKMIASLRARLKSAVAIENYEEAARLRDEIEGLKKK